MKKIILFDGDCNFCNKSVQFIINHDPKGYFYFASLQSECGKSLLKKYNIPEHLDSMILIQNDKWYDQSSAALRVCKYLTSFWKVGYLFLFIPKILRDFVYQQISNRRHQFFRKKTECIIPSSEVRKRFL